MAVTYEDFKKQFEQIKKEVDTEYEAIDKDQRYMGQTTGVIKEGTKELGLRVQELKDQGHAGTSIDKFMFDSDISKMVTAIKQYLAGMQKELVNMAVVRQDILKTVKKYQDLKVATGAEIAERKKQVSTKLGTGNKSLPDMEKLLAEMKKYGDQSPYVKVEAFEPEKYDEHLKETTAAIAKECTQAKAVALSAFQEQMTEQALNTRVLIGNVNKAKGWYAEVTKECTAAQKALAAKNNKDLMMAKAQVTKPMKELTDMNTMYQNALKDQWLSARLKTSKDKGTIEGQIKLILDMKTKASAEVGKIANARL